MLTNTQLKAYFDEMYTVLDSEAQRFSEQHYQAFEAVAILHMIGLCCVEYLEFFYGENPIVNWNDIILGKIGLLFFFARNFQDLATIIQPYEIEIAQKIPHPFNPHDIRDWYKQQQEKRTQHAYTDQKRYLRMGSIISYLSMVLIQAPFPDIFATLNQLDADLTDGSI